MTITVEHRFPIDAETRAFFEMVEHTYIDLGLTDNAKPRPFYPTDEAWVALDDGKIVGIFVMRRVPDIPKRVIGMISYVAPEARGKGVYTLMADTYDAALIAQGVTHVIGHVVAQGGDPEASMKAITEKRGGWIQQYRYCRPIPAPSKT